MNEVEEDCWEDIVYKKVGTLVDEYHGEISLAKMRMLDDRLRGDAERRLLHLFSEFHKEVSDLF